LQKNIDQKVLEYHMPERKNKSLAALVSMLRRIATYTAIHNPGSHKCIPVQSANTIHCESICLQVYMPGQCHTAAL